MATIAIIDSDFTGSTDLTGIIKIHIKDAKIFNYNNIAAFHTSFLVQTADVVILGPKASSNNPEYIDLSFITLLQNGYPQVPVIIYDEKTKGIKKHTIDQRVILYLKAGVYGYLFKQNSTPELIECIETVLKKKRYVCKEVMEMILDDYVNVNEILRSN